MKNHSGGDFCLLICNFSQAQLHDRHFVPSVLFVYDHFDVVLFCIFFSSIFACCTKTVTYRVYQLLGESGTYYGVRFGKNIPWVTEFPFGYIKDPQYVGSILSLLACLSWVPIQYILLWILGYVFMIYLESKEDPATRAKALS